MTLIHAGGDGGGFEHCVGCGALAAGPCARCRNPVCGNCCVLTEGGAGVWAICLPCDRRGGRSLRSGWWTVLAWLAAPIVGLVVLITVVYWLFG